MKSKYLFLTIFSLILFSVGCEEHTPQNPYDPGYSPDKWMPENLKASTSGQPDVTLSWDMSVKLYDKICIDRKRQNENWETKIASVDKRTNSWTDVNIIPDKSKPYEYRVYAVAGDSESSFTSVTYTPGVPVPGNPQVNKISERKYKFTWDQAEEGLDILERKTGEGSWSVVKDSIPANQTFSSVDGKNSTGCFDENVPLNQSVYYRVCRIIKGIKSAYSEFNQVNTELNSPSQLTYEVLNDTTIQLRWTDNSDTEEGYRVYRKVGVNNDTWSLLKELPEANITTFKDGLVPLDERVYYKVSSYFQDTESLSGEVYSDPGTPGVVINSAQSSTPYSAVCSGEVTSTNRSILLAKGLVWDESSSPTLENCLGSTNDGNEKGVFSDSITGLNPGTTYYVKVYATSDAGTTYTNSIKFATGSVDITPPGVVSYSPSGTTAINPSIGLTFDEDVQLSTGTIKIYKSSDNSLAQTIDASSMTVSGKTLNAGNTVNLEYGTSYYLNVAQGLVTDMSGNLFAGITDNSTWAFTTEATVPTVTTDGINDAELTYNSVTLNGTVTSDGGGSVTDRGFYYGTSASALNTKVNSGSGTGSFLALIDKLTGNTLYYFKAYASNSAGTEYGEVLNFTTPVQPIPPTVTTNQVTNPTTNSATCGGNVTDNGGAAVTARGVCWSTSPNPTIADSKTVDGSGTGTFTSSLTGLNCGTTYYVRAYATNSEGQTGYGSDTEQSFSTIACIDVPKVITLATDVSGNTLTLKGQIESDGNGTITERGFNIFIDGNWEGDGAVQTTDNPFSVSMIMSDQPAGSYQYKAYAVNSAGKSYGDPVAFTIPNYDDFYVTNASVAPTTMAAGDKISVSCDLNYDGNSAAPLDVYVGYYLSTNTTWDTNDTRLVYHRSSLSTSTTVVGENETFNVPSDTPAGTYYILFVADSEQGYNETNENNNVTAIQITIEKPLVTTTFIATADAHVFSQVPDYNYGSDTEFAIYNPATGGTAYAFVRFSLNSIPSGSNIVAAKLRLYVMNKQATNPYEISVYKIESDWLESTITWNNMPVFYISNTDGVHKSFSTNSNVWIEFDITSIAKLWMTGTNNYGVALRGSIPTDEIWFDSREATNKPQLVITYQ